MKINATEIHGEKHRGILHKDRISPCTWMSHPPWMADLSDPVYLKRCRSVHYGLFCINFEFSKYYIKVLSILTPKFLVCTPFTFCTQHEYPSCLTLAQPGWLPVLTPSYSQSHHLLFLPLFGMTKYFLPWLLSVSPTKISSQWGLGSSLSYSHLYPRAQKSAQCILFQQVFAEWPSEWMNEWRADSGRQVEVWTTWLQGLHSTSHPHFSDEEAEVQRGWVT